MRRELDLLAQTRKVTKTIPTIDRSMSAHEQKEPSSKITPARRAGTA